MVYVTVAESVCLFQVSYVFVFKLFHNVDQSEVRYLYLFMFWPLFEILC